MNWTALVVVTAFLAAGAALVATARPVTAAVEPAAISSNVMARDSDRKRRFRKFLGVALFAHGAVLLMSILQVSGCQHERPLGILGGSGNQIAQGDISTNLRQVLQEESKRRKQEKGTRHVTRESLLRVMQRDRNELGESRDAQLRNVLDDNADAAAQGGRIGLPGGKGSGSTAAGSPYGTVIGGKLWLYRLRHGGDDWDANPKALPMLLREVHKALGVEVASKQEVVTMSDLPSHGGKYMPTLLFMTGLGRVEANDRDRANLRDYLLNGGLLVADSSGGNFEQQFVGFIGRVLPDHRLRVIELDNEIYRGDDMPYQLPRGCPIYRNHGTSSARGIFDAKSGRLMVFLSPGDMGSAWASVELGRPRGAVELSFQMGTNLVAYGMLHTRDLREEKKKATEQPKEPAR